MTNYMLLHKTHGLEQWVLLAEGSAKTVQSFLDGAGCYYAGDYRVAVSDRDCVVKRPRAEEDDPPTFYVNR